MLDDGQKRLLASLGLPQSFDGLDDDALVRTEETLSTELQRHGINAKGDGLNEHGKACLRLIEAIPD